jgi:hypothetical protein
VPQSVVLFLLIHLVLSPLLSFGGSAKINIFGIKGIDLGRILKTLCLPVKTVVIVMLFAVSLIVSAIFIFVKNPAFRIEETPPIIYAFDITHIDSAPTKIFPPGSLDPGDGILVKARIEGGDENSCQWFVSTGKIIPSKCQVRYTSTTGGVDVLTLTVQSTCGTLETSSTLCINADCLKPILKPTP